MSTSPGRPTDEDLTRRILEATVRLVMATGYDQLRMEHVAKEAGCGKAAIYRRYPDKAQLVAAAALSVFILRPTPDTGNLADDLMAHADVNRRSQSQASAHGVLAVYEPAVYAIVDESYYEARREQGRELVRRGIERGEIDSDVDVDVVLDTLAGITLFRETLKQLPMSTATYRRLIEALIAHPPLVSDAIA